MAQHPAEISVNRPALDQASILAVMRVFKVPTVNTPTIDRIVAACDAHPAFQKADPMRQVGAPA